MSALIFPSLQTFFDVNGKPLRGAKAYFYQPGTTTPLTVYADAASSVSRLQPVSASSFGRFPAIFCDVQTVRVRVVESSGAVIEDIDNLPATAVQVVGGGGGTSVDPNALYVTGDVAWNLTPGTRPGFVRLNGSTISSGLGGGVERANDDTQALFVKLWNNVGTLAVSGGRGASAAADFSANKTLALPDLRGRSLVGLDGMGSAVAGRLTGGALTSGGADAVGSSGGFATHTLIEPELASHSHSYNSRSSATQTLLAFQPGASNQTVLTGGLGVQAFNSLPAGSGTPHNNLPPFMLGTWYMRL
jgi:microcystin-dependent protein